MGIKWTVLNEHRSRSVKAAVLVAGLSVAMALFGLLPESSRGSQKQIFQRVAIVIGNSDYKQSPLKNPRNDARAISTALRSYGFDVSEFYDLRGADIERISQIIKTKVSPHTTFFFYYAGHGIQVDGSNYFPNVDADFKDLRAVQRASIKLNDVLSAISSVKPKASVVVLDACRDNPFDAAADTKDGPRGLARAVSPPGSVIFYATRPGSTASDGRGDNGLFTEILLKEISNPQLPLELLFRRVSSGVFKVSKGEQEPWVEGVIREEVVIAAREEPIAPASISPEPTSPPTAASVPPAATTAVPTPSSPTPVVLAQAEALRSLKALDFSQESVPTQYYCEDGRCMGYQDMFGLMRKSRSFPSILESIKEIKVCDYDLSKASCSEQYLSHGAGISPLILFTAAFGTNLVTKSMDVVSFEKSNGGGLTFASEPKLSIIRKRLGGTSNDIKCSATSGRIELMSDRMDFEVSTSACIQATPPFPWGYKITFDVLAYDHTNKELYVRWKQSGYSVAMYITSDGIGKVSLR